MVLQPKSLSYIWLQDFSIYHYTIKWVEMMKEGNYYHYHHHEVITKGKCHRVDRNSLKLIPSRLVSTAE